MIATATETSLTSLPDSLLATIFYYLDDYDQRVFLGLNLAFARLGEGISSITISFPVFLCKLLSKRWKTIENGYNRVQINFMGRYWREIENFRGWIVRSYRKLLEEEGREERHLPPPTDRLYEMVCEMWPFSSVLILTTDLRNALSLLQRNKLLRLQKLILDCGADWKKDDYEAPLLQLFDLLRKNQLQLKVLDIMSDLESDEEEDIESVPPFPHFSCIPGLQSLFVQGFVITENPGDGFKYLKELELDCMLQCDVTHFDGVKRLILQSCGGVRELSALKITREVHIHGTLNAGDQFNAASLVELEVNDELREPVHLAQFENARTVAITGWIDTTLVLPEKLPEKLKELHIDCFAPFLSPLPPNNLKKIEFSNLNPEHLIQGDLSNIEQIRFSRCPSFPLQLLGSNIKTVILHSCEVEDYSPLGRYEKVGIFGCTINHTLKLSEVKELTIHDCSYGLNEEDKWFIPLLSDCPKLEVLDVDFIAFHRHDVIASDFPSLKKIVLRRIDPSNLDLDIFSFSDFTKCLMPKEPQELGHIVSRFACLIRK